MKKGPKFTQPEGDPDTFREFIGQTSSLPLTVFPNKYAKTMRVSSESLDNIARSVQKTTANRKHDLPLLKLAPARHSGKARPQLCGNLRS